MTGCSTVTAPDAGDVPAQNNSTNASANAASAVPNSAVAATGKPEPTVAVTENAPASQPSKAWRGEYRVLITSEPSGSVVVINGIPVGATPRRVLLPGNAQGFSRQNVSIRVRFVANNPNEKSQTVEQKLTPLEKIPERIDFSRAGAKRVLPDTSS